MVKIMAKKKKYYRNNFTQKLWRESWALEPEVIIFDTETTGLEDNARIIQLSAVKCEYDDELNIIEKERFNTYIKSPVPISPKIESLTGITNQMLDDAPDEETIFPEIRKFFGDNPCCAAYNADFDYGKMKALYERNSCRFEPSYVLDILEMARDTDPRCKSYKLRDIAEENACDAGLTFHNSVDDVTASRRLMQVFVKNYDEMGMNLGKVKPYVYYCSYYEMKRHTENRIYVGTNVGTFIFNTYFRYWSAKDEEIDMETIDLDTLMERASQLCECQVNEFRKFKRRADRRNGVHD